MTKPIFTIGHSNRAISEFLELLAASQITRLVDVRTLAGSKANPQFHQEALRDSLMERQISYEHIAALGGLRGKSRVVVESPNGYWENRSFRNYADYAMTEPFRAGLAELLARAKDERCAIMCAEAVWWRCHRRIIADYLLARGLEVIHILGLGHAPPATLTPGAVVEGETVRYPAA